MNDRMDVLTGAVSVRDDRIVGVGAEPDEAHDVTDRRRRRLPAARIHPDPHPPLPDALPRLRRRPAAARLAAHAHLADGSRAHARVAARGGAARVPRAAAQRHHLDPDDGDGARHRSGLRGRSRDRHPRHDRQVPDGRAAARGAGAAARGRRSGRSTRAWRCIVTSTARATAASAPHSRRALPFAARASCSRRWPTSRRASWRSCTRTPPSSRTRSTGAPRHRARQHRIPERRRAGVAATECRALRLGGRERAGDPGRARRQGDALPRLQPQARVGHRAGAGAARARHLRVARQRRRRVQQPPRHVRRDAPGRDAAGHAARAWRAAGAHARCGWPRATARGRSGSRPTSARSRSGSAPTWCSSTPAPRMPLPHPTRSRRLSTPPRPSDVRMTMVDGRDPGAGRPRHRARWTPHCRRRRRRSAAACAARWAIIVRGSVSF